MILRELGRLLLETQRKTDSCYRYGGEEFLILIPHTSLSGGEMFADRLLDRIHDYLFKIGDHSLRITVSKGIAAYQRGEVSTLNQLLKCADEALYESQNAGRNCIGIWQTNPLPDY